MGARLPRAATVFNELGRSRGKSAFTAQIEFDEAKLTKVVRKLNDIGGKFAVAASRVNAAFGAYMPYSAALELGYTHYISKRWHEGRPHIVPAVAETKDSIAREVAAGYAVILNSIAGIPDRKLSTYAIQQQMEAVWYTVLNGKVRSVAVAKAEALGIRDTGMHISTIQGFGKAPTADWILSTQRALMASRRALVSATNMGAAYASARLRTAGKLYGAALMNRA